jgi:flagellar motor switch protein FliM
VLKLQRGDIIKLEKTKVSSDMELKIGNRKKFFVRPGVVGNRVAVQVTGVSESFVNEDEVFKQIEGGE